MTFNDNYAKGDGGAMNINKNSYFIVNDKSHVTFKHNKAERDGELCTVKILVQCWYKTHQMFFQNNEAKSGGGAVTMANGANVTFTRSPLVLFTNNKAMFGGALLESDSNLTIDGKSTITFNNNTALYGGSITVDKESVVIFKGSSVINFINNNALHGGAIFPQSKSAINWKERPLITFNRNIAQV